MSIKFVKCARCTETFPYRSNKIYCSRRCKGKARIRRQHPYRNLKKDYCEECGFKPKHHIQLDVDHIDGDHKNNNSNNLKTLCANCHRLKTYISKEGPWKNSKMVEDII